MLVLSRKEQERLVIDGNIIVTIVRISGGCVRIGIEAPAKIQIQREELRQAEASEGAHALSRVA
jgi:carbon storage regulator